MVPAVPQICSGTVPGSVVPGGLDEQPPGVAVAGLGDRSLRARRDRGVFGGHQPEVGADRSSGPALPAANLYGQPERGQCRDPAKAAEPSHHRDEIAVGGHRRDRYIQPIPPVYRREPGVASGLVRQLQTMRVEVLDAQPGAVHLRSRVAAVVDNPLPQR